MLNQSKLVLGAFLFMASAVQAEPTQLKEGVSFQTINLNRQGLGIVLGHSDSSMPVGAVYDKDRYFPEIQESINKKIKESAQKGFTPTGYETKAENQVYTLSRNNFEVLLITGFTLNPVSEKIPLLFIVPIERLLISAKSPSISVKNDVVYWQRLEVITLDSLSLSETRLK